MANTTIEEYGLRFVQVCFENFWGGWLLPLLFAAAMVWCLLRHRKQAPVVFLGYVVFLVLTVYNPFFVKYIVPKVNFEEEYYRFFWILPVIPGLAYYGTRMFFAKKFRVAGIAAVVVLAACVMHFGQTISGVAYGITLPDNLYKVPDSLRAICDVIHQDSDQENPGVVFEMDLNAMARQYDPSLYLVIYRDYGIYYNGSTVAGTPSANNRHYKVQSIIMDVVYSEKDIPVETFRAALEWTKTDYLVVYANHTNHEYLREAGCENIAMAGAYAVYRYERT